jgi:hypothetical protein
MTKKQQKKLMTKPGTNSAQTEPETSTDSLPARDWWRSKYPAGSPPFPMEGEDPQAEPPAKPKTLAKMAARCLKKEA